MTCLISCLVITLGTPPIADASVRVRVQPLRTIIEGLAQEQSLSIEVDADIAGKPIYFDRRSMSASQALDSLGKAVFARLERKGSRLLLTRNTEDKIALLAWSRAYYRRTIEGWLAHIAANQRLAAPYGDPYAQTEHFQGILNRQGSLVQQGDRGALAGLSVIPAELSPIGRLYSGIVAAIGAESLALTDPDRIRIWSNRPTSRELKCPDGDKLFSQFVEQQDAFSRKTGNVALASARRFAMAQVGGTRFTLYFYDQSNSVITSYGVPIGLRMAGPYALYYADTASAPLRSPNGWIDIPSPDLELSRFLNEFTPPTPPPIPATLSEPERVDPLDGLVGLGLSGIDLASDAKGVVVVLKDELLRVAEACAKDSRLSLPAFKKLLEDDASMKREDVDGIAIYRPENFDDFERRTVDRFALAKQVKALLGKPTIRATDLAAAFSAIRPCQSSRLSERLLKSIARYRPHTSSNVVAFNGSELAFIGTSLTAKRGATTLLDPSVEPFRTMILRGVSEGWLRLSGELSGAKRTDTEVLLNELGVSGVLVLELESEQVLRSLGVGKADLGHPGMYQPPQTIGSMWGGMIGGDPLYKFSVPKIEITPEIIASRIQGFGNYIPGTRNFVNVTFQPVASLTKKVSLEETIPGNTQLTFDKLPNAVKEAMVAAALKVANEDDASKQRSGNVGGSGGNQPPPP